MVHEQFNVHKAWYLSHDQSALQMAILTNEYDVVHDLVAAGADLEERVSQLERITPLHRAIEFLRVDMVRLLVEAGADVDAKLDCYHLKNNPTVTGALGATRFRAVKGTFHFSTLHQVRQEPP